MLTFDAPSHEYRWDGIVQPGTTSILDDLGLYPVYPDGPYRERGSAVHLVTALYERGQLDMDAWRALDDQLPPPDSKCWPHRIGGYVDGHLLFLREVGPTWDAIEEMFYHPAGYCGTLDRRGELVPGEKAILDLKCSSSAPVAATALQTAAYAVGIDPTNYAQYARYGLQLPGDGTYRLHKYTDPHDFVVWGACVALWKWKHQ